MSAAANGACIACGIALIAGTTWVSGRLARETAPAGLLAVDSDASIPAMMGSAPRPWVAAEHTIDGRLTITGLVPDTSTRERLLELAHAMHGADQVTDAIVIDAAVVREAWLASHTLFAPLGAFGQRRANLDGKVLTLEGEVGSEAARRDIEAVARTVLGNEVRIANLIQVRAPSATALR